MRLARHAIIQLANGGSNGFVITWRVACARDLGSLEVHRLVPKLVTRHVGDKSGAVCRNPFYPVVTVPGAVAILRTTVLQPVAAADDSLASAKLLQTSAG